MGTLMHRLLQMFELCMPIGNFRKIRKENTMTTTYTSYDQLPLSLCANDIAAVLGISRANAYTLMRSKGFPTIFIGKRMIVPRDKFIEWMDLQISA